jgi:hypothetical protein
VDPGDTNYNNNFDKGCADMTLAGRWIYSNNFGQNCVGSIVQGGFYNNVLCPAWNRNLMLHISLNYLGGFKENIFAAGGANSNVFSAESENNYVTGLFTLVSAFYHWSTNTHKIEHYEVNIGSDMRNNIIPKMNRVTMGNTCQNNIIGGGAFGGGLSTVVVGDNFIFNHVDNITTGTFGNNIQYNQIKGNQSNLTLPNNFQYNKVWGIFAAGTTFAVGTSKNTFNNDFGGGTVAIPLNLNNCVFNKPVSGLQVASTAVTLNGVVSNVSITSKTLPASLSNVTISNISPDGSLWIDGIDDTGHVSPEKIV